MDSQDHNIHVAHRRFGWAQAQLAQVKRHAPDLEARGNKRPRIDSSVSAIDVGTGDEILIDRPQTRRLPWEAVITAFPPSTSALPLPPPPSAPFLSSGPPSPVSRPWHKKQKANSKPVYIGKPTEDGNGFFCLKPEIRQQIFRHLLLSQNDIRVSSGWSEVPLKARLGLHTAVLGVNRTAADEGRAILYGENTFAYHLKDATAAQDDKPITASDRRLLDLPRCAYRLRKLTIVGNIAYDKLEHALRLASSLRALAVLHASRLDIPALTLRLFVRMVREKDGHLKVGEADKQARAAAVEEEDEEEPIRFSVAKHSRNRPKNRPPPAFLAEPTKRLGTADFFDPQTAHGAVVLDALGTIPAKALHLHVYFSGAHYHTAIALPGGAALAADDDTSLVRHFGQLHDRGMINRLVAAGRFLWTKVQRRSSPVPAPQPPRQPYMLQPSATERKIRDAAERQRREEQQRAAARQAEAEAERKAKPEEEKKRRAERRAEKKASGTGEKRT